MQPFLVGFTDSHPRVTSAIISSHNSNIGFVCGEKFPSRYVIDKALNLGNSGGPIILEDSGKVISVSIKFDPLIIKQPTGTEIIVPSLYGITSSLKNIEEDLKKLGINQ